MSRDPYEILGVKKTATDAEIKKAYRKIARTSHPDLNPDDKAAEERFKAVSSAYDLLKDPELRARFDRGEIDATGAERPDRTFYRDYADSGASSHYQSGRGFDGFDDSSDIFAEFFRQQRQDTGGARGRGQEFSARGHDVRYSLEIPFLEAVRGGKTRITLPTGENLEVKIPQGTDDGKTLRLRGKGEQGFGGGPQGDAYVTLSVHPHPLYRREGNDIVITLPITIDEAVLGGKVETPTIDGTVKLTIPKGATSGQVLRLRGRGVKPANKKTAGDQRVELRIMSPPKIDESLASFMQEWRKTHAYDPREGLKT